MDEMTRPDILRSVAVAGASATIAAAPGKAIADQRPEAEKIDRQRVLARGMTEAEADCWEAVNRAAGEFLALPKLHSMDDHKIAPPRVKAVSRPSERWVTFLRETEQSIGLHLKQRLRHWQRQSGRMKPPRLVKAPI